jgi:hypothetical protein
MDAFEDLTSIRIALQPKESFARKMLLKIPLEVSRLVLVFGHCEVEANFLFRLHMDLTAVVTDPGPLDSQPEQSMHGYIPMAMSVLNGLALQTSVHGFW